MLYKILCMKKKRKNIFNLDLYRKKEMKDWNKLLKISLEIYFYK